MTSLEERLERAVANISFMAAIHWEVEERIRLQGKVEGVKLALSYMREER